MPSTTATQAPAAKISIKSIANVTYTHFEFEKACTFLKDFGLLEVSRTEDRVFFRGYGTEPYVYCAVKGSQAEFGGACWTVDSLEDLELAAKILPNNSGIYTVTAPGGGKGLSFTDPVEGFPFHLVWGQKPCEAGDVNGGGEQGLEERPFNYPGNKYRSADKTVRMAKGPAPVHKLGHFGVCVTDFKTMYAFFTTHFNLEPSELVYNEEKELVATFLHLNRGEEWVDHHNFFITQGAKAHVHHSSFEVHDIDVQGLGHDFLRSRGYELCWGVGRHIMGSQIFDYW